MFFLQFGASWKEVEYAIIINHVPHWMAVISELSHFCLPQENLVNNDYWSTVTFLIWEGHFHCVFFSSFVKMLYAQHDYSLGRSSFPFLCVCSFTSTDTFIIFMLKKCLMILVIAYRIFFTLHPHRIKFEKFCHHVPPKFYFLKHRSGFSDFLIVLLNTM